MKITLSYEEAVKALKDYYSNTFNEVPEVQILMKVDEPKCELTLFKVEVDKANQADKPWYPDNDKWYEVPMDSCCTPYFVEDHDRIEILLKEERDNKEYNKSVVRAGDVIWDYEPDNNLRIVAYKFSE